eukprot:jgi/Galph1/4532/GphlegSOOS_G3146.1
MSLEQVFEKAAEQVKKLPSASNNDKLELYGYYKQANEGDCSTGKPGGLFNQKDKAKWEAWNSKKGTSKEEAQRKYIEKVDQLCKTNLLQSISK